MTSKTCLIIVNWNGSSDTLTCIRSLKAMSNQDYQIVLVDNCSLPEDRRRLEKGVRDNPQITVLINAENRGYSGGNNTGIQHALRAGFEFLILLNNDTVVSPDFLSMLQACRRENSGPAVWGAKIFYTGRQQIYAKGGGWINLWTGRDGLIGARHPDTAVRDQNVRLDYVAGCCLAADAEIFQRVGLLDNDYFLYSEESDFCLRATSQGYPMRYCSRATLEHAFAQSTGFRSDVYVYYFLRNKLLFMHKCARWYQRPTFFLFILGYYFSGFALTILLRRPAQLRFLFSALWDGLRGAGGKNRRLTS